MDEKRQHFLCTFHKSHLSWTAVFIPFNTEGMGLKTPPKVSLCHDVEHFHSRLGTTPFNATPLNNALL